MQVYTGVLFAVVVFSVTGKEMLAVKSVRCVQRRYFSKRFELPTRQF